MLRSYVLACFLVLSNLAASAFAAQPIGYGGSGGVELGSAPTKNVQLKPLPAGDQHGESGAYAGVAVSGDTFSIAPLVEDATSAYYATEIDGPTSHVFDDTNDSGGNNYFGTAGGFFLVLEGVQQVSANVDRIIVELRAVNSEVEAEPWVDVYWAGNGLIDWRFDLGTGAGGSDPIHPGTAYTVIDSGFAILNSASEQIGLYDLTLDTSTSSSLGGVALLHNGGADIAGVDVASIVMYWDIQYPSPADLAMLLVDAVDGAYVPGESLDTFVGIGNIGDLASNESSFDLYVSTDSNISSGDTLLGNFVVPSLEGSETMVGNAPSTLPANLPNGNYYIGGIINHTDATPFNNVNHDPTPIYVSSDPAIRVRPQSLNFIEPEQSLQSSFNLMQGMAEPHPGKTGDAFASLLAKASKQGEVRVIVGLEMPFQPEGLLAAGHRQSQQQNIQSVASQVITSLRGTGYSENRRFRFVPYLALTVSPNALQALANSPLISSISEDSFSSPFLASSSNVIGSPLAWAEGYDGSGQVIAVLDTGVDKTHPWFTAVADKVVSEACYSTVTTDTASLCPGGVSSSIEPGSGMHCDVSLPGCDHGTHVAGIAAGNDGIGPDFGVARGADLIAMQVFVKIDDENICGAGEAPCVRTLTSDQIAALERVYELRETYDIAAVNMSLGGGQYFDQASCDANNGPIKSTIDNLRSVGIPTIIASGNDGFVESIGSPACVSSAISVGNSTDSDLVAGSSNIYPQLHLLAPGTSIDSALPDGGIGNKDGTSMATPQVAGAWAVLKQVSWAADVDSVLSSLQSTGTHVDDLRPGGFVTDMPRINLDLAMSVNRTTFGIFNDGPATLHVTSITPETPAPWISISHIEPFTVARDGMEVVQISIDYDLAPIGETQTRLLIVSNDPDDSPWPSGVYVNVSRPVPAEQEFSSDPPGGSTIDLGDVEILSESAASLIQVSNIGSQDLTISCGISGANAAEFSIQSCESPVGPVSSTNVQITCTPGSVGARTALLTIQTNDADESEVSYSLDCTGTPSVSGDVIFSNGFEK